jgi:quercetin dioxygenase-like cupin family protein
MRKLHPVGNTKRFGNDAVCVWQIDLDGHEELPLHQHESPYLVMHETDGLLGVTESDGSTHERHVTAGSFDWHPVGELHALVNLSDVRYRNLLIEFRVEGKTIPHDA